VISGEFATLPSPGILDDAPSRADRYGPCARDLLNWRRSARKNDGAKQMSLDNKASASI
jgi:hypothetical protein